MPPEDNTAFDKRYMVPGLSRGLALLQQFSRTKPHQKVPELAASLGLSRSATFRLVYTLERAGFLSRDQSGHLYSVTSKVLSLGFDYIFAQPLTEAAEDTLRELSNDSKAGAHLVTLDGWHSVYLARVVPPVLLIANLQIGTRLPAHLTASGRVLLAYRDEAALRKVYNLLVKECTDQPVPKKFDDLLRTAAQDRARGYVFSRSRFDPSVSSIAYPICDRAGQVAAAINVVGSNAIFKDDAHIERLRRLVDKAASKLSANLGYVKEQKKVD
jgi:IclR family transcriptional regulator, pca regulon regulatory protein